jgi:hypothetical protein
MAVTRLQDANDAMKAGAAAWGGAAPNTTPLPVA